MNRRHNCQRRCQSRCQNRRVMLAGGVRLLALCLATFAVVAPALAQSAPVAAKPDVNTLVRQLRSADREQRSRAIRGFAELHRSGDWVSVQEGVVRVAALLSDPNPDIRANAARVFWSLGADGAPAVPALTLALSDPAPNVRSVAAAALGIIGDAARPALPRLRQLFTDPYPIARANAARATSELASPDAELADALRRLLDDPDPSPRASAAFALRGFGAFARPAVPRLIELLRTDTTDVRHSAARTLGELKAVGTPALVALAEGVDHPEDSIAIWSGEAIAEICVALRDNPSALTDAELMTAVDAVTAADAHARRTRPDWNREHADAVRIQRCLTEAKTAVGIELAGRPGLYTLYTVTRSPWTYIALTLVGVGLLVYLVVRFAGQPRRRRADDYTALYLEILDRLLQDNPYLKAMRQVEPETLDRFLTDYRQRLRAGQRVGNPAVAFAEVADQFKRRRLGRATPETLTHYAEAQLALYEGIGNIALLDLGRLLLSHLENPPPRTMEAAEFQESLRLFQQFHTTVGELIVLPSAPSPLPYDDALAESALTALNARLTESDRTILAQSANPSVARARYAAAYLRRLREIVRLPDALTPTLLRTLGEIPPDDRTR